MSVDESAARAVSRLDSERNAAYSSCKIFAENADPTRLNQDQSTGTFTNLINTLKEILEFAEVLSLDALHREESCGGHFREESQTEEGEAKRDDEHFCYVGAWEFKGDGEKPELHKEPLTFDNVHLVTRSYK